MGKYTSMLSLQLDNLLLLVNYMYVNTCYQLSRW